MTSRLGTGISKSFFYSVNAFKPEVGSLLVYKIQAHLQDSVAVGCKYDRLQLVAKILKGLDYETESNILTKIILLSRSN